MDTDPAAGASPLEERLAALGEPDLVPAEVLRLYRSGRVLKAHAALRAAIPREARPERAAHQRQLLEDLRLWVEPASAPTMQTVNGIGTRLVGRYQPADDGCYVGTLCFVLLFIPLWPFSSWLVSPAEGGAWYFLGRTPLVPSLRRVRGFVARAAMLAAAFGAWSVYQSWTHLDVLALNGFDVPMLVTVGDRSETLAPREHRVLAGIPGGEVHFSARVGDAGEPLEDLVESLSGSADETVVYNVAGRAVLRLDYVRYGTGDPPAGQLLPPQPVLHLPEVDYPFTDPPQQKRVEEGRSIQNSVLAAIDAGAQPAAVAQFLLGEGRAAQAVAVSRAELRVHPENASLAWVAARYGLAADREAGRALFRECLERAPDEVDLHRLYQELWRRDERGPLLEEYRARLAAAPDSAREHYLVGRILDAPREAIAAYRRSLELDPAYGPSLRAWGYQAASLGDWAMAEQQYGRYAAAGSEQALEVLPERLAVARARGAGRQELERLLQQVEKAGAEVASSWRARLGLEASGDVDAALAALDAYWPSASPVPPPKLAEQARLALVAGDLDRARQAIAAGVRELDVPLLLALSDGATADDRAAVRPLLAAGPPYWLAPAHRVLALALAEAEGWEAEAAKLGEDLEWDDAGPVVAAVRAASADGAALAAALAQQDLPVRASASFAVAWRLRRAGSRSPLAGRLLADARRLGLPGQLPFAR